MKVLPIKHFILLLLFGCSIAVFSQPKITYEITFENAIHHEAHVKATFTGISGEHLQLRMSRTSPGRYAMHDFAKNIYDIRIVDGGGTPIIPDQPNPHQWNITGHDGTAVIAYTVFGDVANGTYNGIDGSHAHLNMPATMVWARGYEEAPVSVTFHPPSGSGWKVATQLTRTESPFVFTAPNLQYLMDSPVELSKFSTRSWKTETGSSAQIVSLAVHHQGSDDELDAFTEMAKAVVTEETAIFGELPSFDHGEYLFIVDLLPYVSGDGMEHRNSTIITGTRPLKTDAVGTLSTLAHEFFHCWNIERIRPRSIEPFNFEDAAVPGELWFGEGFTSYYEVLSMHRAGIIHLDRFASTIGKTLNQVLPAPGRERASIVEMSRRASFVDGAATSDRTNTLNTYVSYYPHGAAIALALDLTLRTSFPDVTLDDFMRAVWTKHGESEIPYTVSDLRAILRTVTGDQKFADDFFDRYIEGKETARYEQILGTAGLLLRKSKPGKASIGNAAIVAQEGKVLVISAPSMKSPLYLAGLDRGDWIQSIDGIKVATPGDLDTLLGKRSPGEQMKIQFEQRGSTKSATVLLEESGELEVVPYEHASMAVTKEMQTLRDRWLKSKAPTALPELRKFCPKCRRDVPFANEHCSFDGEPLLIVRQR